VVLKRPMPRPDDDTPRIARLHAQHRDVAQAIARAQAWCALVRERHADGFDPGLACAIASRMVPLQRLATGLRADDEAVNAGMMRPWSIGPVEGHISRVKLLKRSLCGRATRDLLRRRLLLAA
jgi:transposase